MAGVAGPMVRSDRRRGVRFLIGLVAGEVAAGVVLAVPAYLLAKGTHAALPAQVRLWSVAALCVLFGLADLTNRTPHLWRQVPQHLIHQLPPGQLGIAWGFDLGLLVTTQKTVSLIWLSIAAAVLLDPATAAAVVIGVAVLSSAGVVVTSIGYRPGLRLGLDFRRLRWASGGAMMILFVLTAQQAWSA